MYSQTRLTALAQARVQLELEQIEVRASTQTAHTIQRKLDYLDEEIASCRQLAPAEMASFSVLLAQETMRATDNYEEGE